MTASPQQPTIALVVAVADNGVIGRDGGLPWRLPDDLKHFKQLTTGHAVVMGRRTWESIGRPLPNRLNIVLSRSLSRDPQLAMSAVEGRSAGRRADLRRAGDLDEALAIARGAGHARLFAIGGRAIYEAALPIADELHLTHVRADVPGDVTLPAIDLSAWRCVDSRHHPADDRHAYPFDIRRYAR